MKYLLDTDVFSEIAKEVNPRVAERIALASSDEVATSVITIGEVRYGALSRPSLSTRLLARIEALAAAVPLAPINAAVAERYGELRARLRSLGTPIRPNDLWIAAVALAHDLTLVTGNEREFSRVPTLRLENWMR